MTIASSSSTSPDGRLSEAAPWPWEQNLVRTPDELTRTHLRTSPLLMYARTSTEGGRAAIKNVRNDMRGAARAWAKLGGDVAPLIPTLNELQALFQEAKRQVSTERNGATFAHKFVEIDLRATHGVYLLFTCGSGRKVDDHLRQPAIARLAEVVCRIRPSILFAKHVYRVARSPWALAPLVQELDFCGALLGDGQRGIQVVRDVSALQLFFDAMSGEKEATDIIQKTREGTRNHIAPAMVDGVAVLGCSTPHPPGLARLRMRHLSGTGESVLVLDHEAGLPETEAVAYGMPTLFNDDGSRVDQVALVKWALTQLGKRKAIAIGRDLVAQRLSSHVIRTNRGTSASQTEPGSAIASITRHLDFYETGVMKLRLVPVSRDLKSDEAAEEMEITGFFPPDGAWASQEDWVRIRAWQAHAGAIARARNFTTFAGLAVEVHGLQVGLRSSPFHQSAREEICYKPTVTATELGLKPKSTLPFIPHSVMAAMLVEGIKSAGDNVFDLLDVPRSHPAELDVELAARRERSASIQSQKMSLRRQVAARDENGEPLLTGSLLREVSADHDALADESDENEAAIAHLLERIETADSASARTSTGVTDRALLELVASLSDPFATQYNELWRTAIRDLRLTFENKTHGGYIRGITTKLTSTLRVGTSTSYVDIPLSASFDGLKEKREERVQHLVAAMADGIPYQLTGIACARPARKDVGEHLGLTGKQALLWCTDARIVGIAMRVRPGHGTAAAVATELGEPVHLVERIRDLYWVNPRHQWRKPPSPLVSAMHRAAYRNGGTVPRTEVEALGYPSHVSVGHCLRRDPYRTWRFDRPAGTWVARPCESCGSFALARTCIFEVDGALCLDCELDRSVVSWPLRTYAHLVDDADGWRADGVRLPKGTDPLGAPAQRSSKVSP